MKDESAAANNSKRTNAKKGKKQGASNLVEEGKEEE